MDLMFESHCMFWFYADKRIVNITKVYIERNNLQLELIRYRNVILSCSAILLRTFLFEPLSFFRETTCNMAREFVGYVFVAGTADEVGKLFFVASSLFVASIHVSTIYYTG